MRWPGNTLLACTALTLLVAGTFLNGCARRPWTEAVEGERKEAVMTAFLASVDARSRCSAGSESQLAVTWKSPAQTYAFEAFCQLLEPSYLKLALTGPLGLPLAVIATDSESYQFLDAAKKTSMTGNLGSWAAQNKIPPSLLDSPWISWLMGRAAATSSQVAEILLDGRDRGAWLKIVRGSGERRSEEFILFDSGTGRITERIIIDGSGRVRGVISYGGWLQHGDCPRPAEITISGLPYNASAELFFSEIEAAALAPENFNLPVPASFRKIMAD